MGSHELQLRMELSAGNRQEGVYFGLGLRF
nr:MAG TPA: hypothetical protein [Caudoviricetes sp.]